MLSTSRETNLRCQNITSFICLYSLNNNKHSRFCKVTHTRDFHGLQLVSNNIYSRLKLKKSKSQYTICVINRGTIEQIQFCENFNAQMWHRRNLRGCHCLQKGSLVVLKNPTVLMYVLINRFSRRCHIAQ